MKYVRLYQHVKKKNENSDKYVRNLNLNEMYTTIYVL